MSYSWPHSGISKVEVVDLFGRYDYSISFARPGESEPSEREKVSLLYGDNGNGKTTILNLIFNLLSSSPNQGHRTAIVNAPFKLFRVTLMNGHEITAIKENVNPSGCTVMVHFGGEKILEEVYEVDPQGKIPRRSSLELDAITSRLGRLSADEFSRMTPREIARLADLSREDRYVNYLAEINIAPHFLADDRRMHGDDIEDPGIDGDQVLDARRVRRARGTSLSVELDSAIKRVNELFRQLVISGNASGSRSTDNVYLDLLRRIANVGSSPTEKDEIRDNLRRRLVGLAERTSRFNEFGLAAPLDAVTFSGVLERIPLDRLEIAEDVLGPYLDAQDARLDALNEAETLIRTLVKQVNTFFTDKEVRFTVRNGIQIDAGGDEPLPPGKLSSGERQILLLLVNTIQARHGTRLFLIDEPEISLNVKWQRKLITALLACAEKSNVQFVIATHSIEIITGNTDRLARLTALGDK
ncbi:AAA family ATPase [Streptomyces sp. NPDC086077]|uniref:AAA family ATPase n=1 Tax=Streptomyces sp. NPDC086077 TaxID=3154862 RepID=UPI0034311277